tara:strand:- start:8544 stop:8864 length:321 start_codon:yes stop_codon:yes gene_type:complete
VNNTKGLITLKEVADRLGYTYQSIIRIKKKHKVKLQKIKIYDKRVFVVDEVDFEKIKELMKRSKENTAGYATKIRLVNASHIVKNYMQSTQFSFFSNNFMESKQDE